MKLINDHVIVTNDHDGTVRVWGPFKSAQLAHKAHLEMEASGAFEFITTAALRAWSKDAVA